MNYHPKFKIWWWIILTILSGTFLYLRMTTIISGYAQEVDYILLAFFSILVLAPLFSELSIWGITVKQQLDEAKKEIRQDIKEQFFTLRSEIHNAVNLSSNTSVYMNAPTPDNKLDWLEQQIKPILEDFRKEIGIELQPLLRNNLAISPDLEFAFSSRFHLENEISRLYNNRIRRSCDYEDRFTSMGKMVDGLVKAEVISPPLGRSIREIYSISSAAIHGREPSTEKIGFLKDIVPSLVETLRAIP